MPLIRRTIAICILSGAFVTCPALGADIRSFADANLHAVHFLDEHEGWAAGDQGTIWHTMDGGQVWERQPTGTRATLTKLHVRDYRYVWAAGRDSLPYNPGSAGIILTTDDGGIRWEVTSKTHLAGVTGIHFFDNSLGWAIGETTDQHPTGVYFTTDGTKSWTSVRGTRQLGWTCAWFPPAQPNAPAKEVLEFGVLGGHDGVIATIREGVILKAKADWLPGSPVRDIFGTDQRLWAVGDQAQILYSDDKGASWRRPNVDIPPDIQRVWDLRAVTAVGDHVWAVGRPGTIVLHSKDGGQSWQMQHTGQPLPLDDIHFVSPTHGWAVGALGTILHTADGGQSWTMQRPLTVTRADGQETIVPQQRHAAILWLNDSAERIPLSVVARYGGDEGYYCAAYAALAPDLKENLPSLASRPARFAEAFRTVGGAVAETSWKFPLKKGHEHEPVEKLMQNWNPLYEGKAAEQLQRDLVLAIRIWRPEVVVTNATQASATNPVSAAMVALGAQHAFELAGDPEAFKEQIEVLGLQPHSAKKLYFHDDNSANSNVVHNAGDFGAQLGESYADTADQGMAALLEQYRPTETRAAFVLAKSDLANAQTHRNFLDGFNIMPGQPMRRAWTKTPEDVAEELRKLAERKRNLLAIAASTDNPAGLLAQLKSQTQDLNMLQAGHACFQIAQQYVERGQWHLAHPVFEYVAAYYPEHPLAVEAYRWLIAYQCSGEARQRADRLAVTEETNTRFQRGEEGTTAVDSAGRRQQITPAGDELRWNEGALIYSENLRRISGQLYADPRIQLCLAAAHRRLGNIELLNYHYNSITDADAASRWKDVVAMEKWFFSRGEKAPKQIGWSVAIPDKPYLDGKLDDQCWQNGKQLSLTTDDASKTKQFETRVMLRHDAQFLYLGAQCTYPDASFVVEPVQRKGYDADVSGTDRIELMLDLDRDYNSFYRLQVDQRGLTAEDCWGDKSWNPRWFVAVRSSETGWGVEAAIPLAELTTTEKLNSETWAFNVVRVVPGQAVLSWTHPASADPRPEGFSFLKFVSDDQSRALQLKAD